VAAFQVRYTCARRSSGVHNPKELHSRFFTTAQSASLKRRLLVVFALSHHPVLLPGRVTDASNLSIRETELKV
jgi:hypothetical protein